MIVEMYHTSSGGGAQLVLKEHARVISMELENTMPKELAMTKKMTTRKPKKNVHAIIVEALRQVSRSGYLSTFELGWLLLLVFKAFKHGDLGKNFIYFDLCKQ